MTTLFYFSFFFTSLPIKLIPLILLILHFFFHTEISVLSSFSLLFQFQGTSGLCLSRSVADHRNLASYCLTNWLIRRETLIGRISPLVSQPTGYLRPFPAVVPLPKQCIGGEG